MRILMAEHLGMCFGVRDAIALARGVKRPEQVTVHGELVHNEEVLEDLRRRGLTVAAEGGRDIPASPTVLVTAHGISDRERARLTAAGKSLIDTTCPLVRRVHLAARRLTAQGCFVVVIGRPGHVEVRGIVEDLERYAIVDGEPDIQCWNEPRIGVICQTTTPPDRARALLSAIVAKNPASSVRFLDTICAPTRQRQEALARLLRKVDALVVVGGRKSNNTRQLAALAESQLIPCLLVQGPDDVDPAWCRRFRRIGLTAGTSTPDETVAAVYGTLRRIARARQPMQPLHRAQASRVNA